MSIELVNAVLETMPASVKGPAQSVLIVMAYRAGKDGIYRGGWERLAAETHWSRTSIYAVLEELVALHLVDRIAATRWMVHLGIARDVDQEIRHTDEFVRHTDDRRSATRTNNPPHGRSIQYDDYVTTGNDLTNNDGESDALWSAALAELRNVVAPANYRLWLAPSRALGFSAGALVVGAETKLAAEWLARNLTPMVRKVLSQLAGEALEARFVVGDALELPGGSDGLIPLHDRRSGRVPGQGRQPHLEELG